MEDQMVLKTQQWLNQTYKGVTGYVSVTENGNTGWSTIYALRRALQIELGITQTSTAFGPSTTQRFNQRFPSGVAQQSPNDETEDNIYAIIQGACWCKGYSTGASAITKHFYSGTGGAITHLKTEAGCSETTSTVTLNVMKALLSMDQFRIVGVPTLEKQVIQTIQRTINNQYEAYIGLSPCDGAYGREMNLALIKVLQAIEGYSVADATGTFGNGTKANLPIVPSNGSLPSDTEEAAIKLVRYMLVCNGYDVSITSGDWDTTLQNKIHEFQNDLCIQQANSCNKDTWLALFLSCGNVDRSFIACDTAYGIRGARIQDLIDRNISIIGRYIVGGSAKELDFNEEKTIIDNGFKLFPIFQNNGTPVVTQFTKGQGILDAHYAYRGARRHCIPENAIIYFAIDVDATDAQITTYVLPYFRAINENLSGYRIGVYGTRNVCTRVMEEGYAITCFVSDMSTGYSGNKGFRMPQNWNFDQFAPMSMKNSDGTWAIDKVASSGRFEAVESLSERYLYEGDFVFTGEHSGTNIKYGGNRLRAYITPIGESENVDYSNLHIEFLIRPQTSVSPYYDTFKAIIAPIDGSVHDFAEMIGTDVATDDRDYMRISSDTNYYATYSVVGENGEVLNNVPVRVIVSIETEEY